MLIGERTTGDIDELRRRAAAEPNALRRDRYRAVLLALGGREASDIAASLGRARRSVQDWAYAYRDGGVDAVQPERRLGRAQRLPRECEPRLRARLDAGPTDADGGACTLRGRGVVRILEREFGVRYTLNGAYELLHRLGYSCLAPRPRHERADPEAAAAFRAAAPFLSASSPTRSPRTEGRSARS
jgi:transposase